MIIAAFVFFAIVVIAVPTVVFIVALPEQTDSTTPTTTTTTTTLTEITDTEDPLTSGTPNPATTSTPISATTVKNREGLFIVGDISVHPPELWSPEHSCQLGLLGNQAMNSFTLNTVNKVVINCHNDKCERLDETGSWTLVTNTLVNRKYHTSALYESEILLIGGTSDPTSTEWIPLDGSQAHSGFLIDPGRERHCSIQPSSNVVILTGGRGTGTGNLVTQFILPDGASQTALPPLNVPREIHACGAYDQVCASCIWNTMCTLRP